MASIIKHGFLFVLVVLAGTLGFALIASAAPGRQSAINNPAQRGTTRSAWQASLPRSERGPQLAPPKAGSAIPPIGSQSEIGNRKSAIPLSVPFIQNQGQIADPQVLFYARTFGGTVYVTAEGEIIYALPKAEAVSGQRSEVSRTAVIRETLVDADLTALPTGAERSGAVINSFIGNDPCRWKANIPSFTGVQFGDIYEGVALEVRATGDNVEKIFTVAPGADPARIALRLAGAEDVRITPAGELEARTALGPVRFTAPVAYQRGAAGERQSVSVAYALEGDQVGFCVGAFDAARPLVIDPLLASTFIGGSSSNVISAMALDSQTNVLVAGYTASTDFPTTNSYDTNSYNGGSYDGFIAKFDPQLTNLLAATYLGGVDEDKIMAMAINSNNGYVYVAGYTASTNFPITNALYDTYRGGDYDAFVSVLNSNLTTLTASTYLGGTNVDMAYALALRAGPTQDVFVAGLTSSTNFPIANTFGTTSFQTNLSGSVRSNDAFVIRFNTNLSANLASTYLGGTNDDGAYGIALDTNNFVYVAGYTTSTNFPMTNGAVRTYCGGVRDVFVARLSIALTNLNASTFLGGTSNEVANGIAVAPFTNIVCVVGYTTSTNYPQNPTNNVLATGYTNRLMGGKDAFLTRLDLALTNILASTYLGGTDDDEATAVLAAASTNSLRIYVAGWTTSSNFPVTANAYDTTANGGRDAFISYFGTGDTLQASTYLGGATNDSAYAMALQADSFSLFVAGATASTNFPATLRAYDNDRTGQTNDYGFVTKLGSGLAYGSLKWQVALTNMAGSPSLGWDGTVYCGAGSNLYAFDAQGRQRWKCSATGLLVNSALDDVTGLGCTPAIATNGTIYITTDSGALQAISPTGGVNWTFSGSGKAFESSPAIGSNGTIYFGTLSSKIYAVRDDGTNGVGLWTNTLASSVYASLAIASNGTIIAASANAAWLYILNQTNGNEIQSWSMPNVTYSASPAIGPDGRIYIGNGNELLCFDPTNPGSTQAWATAGPVYVAPTIGSNGMIYVGGGSNLYEFYPDGTTGKVWVTDGAIKSSPAIDSGGFIVVGSYTNGLCSFNPNGTTNWVLPCNEYVFYNSPLIQRDGTIYMTDEKYLYAIFGPAPTARTNWPTARHDVLRTGNAAFDAARILKPTGLTASPTGDYLNVSWSGDPNADYYELWRGTNEPGTNALINTLLTTNCVDTNISPGMIYYYGVRVATPVAMSDFSDSSSSGVPPLPPTNVIASQGNPTNEIVITWNASSNANMYYLWHSQTNATNTAVLLTTTNITGFTNTTFTRGLTYYYWVKAGNGAAGISDFSVGTNGGTPPQCPTNITASTNYFPAVAVAWNASDYATNYAVYRNTSNGIPAGFNYLAVTNGTNYNDVNSTPFQVYYYWIRATNEYGMSEFSVSTNGYRLLPPPQAVTASKGDYHTKIIVSWSNESAATSYLIYRNVTNDSATASNLYETASTNYYDLIIERGIGYYYWVRSKNAYGISADFSDPDIGGTVPPVPLNVNATDGTDENQVIVTWNAATNATGYEVYRQDSYTPWSLTTPLGIEYGTTYSDTQARPGLRYYYWIQATNQFGPIGPSELSGFDTGYCPLTPPSAISASDGVSVEHLYVTWSVSDNASNYELWRGTNSDRAAALMLVNDVATNAYDDTDSVQGVMYYYWVKAKTTQFVSDFSPYDSGYRALREVDIGVSDLVFLPTCMAVDGAPAAVSFRVTNYGVQNMAEPNTWVAYNFYISSNSVFGDTDDKWMGGTNVSLPLAVGNSAVVVLPKAGRDALAVPTVLPGWYYIFVNIQHAAPTKWLDPNLANNTTNRNGGVIRIGASQPAGLLLVNDYNGDGYTDLAMYQESTGTWQVWFFGAQGFTMAGYGGVGFKAVPSDYDGDGKADLAVYQEATGTWKIWLSSCDYALAEIYGCGGAGFEPVPSDYDGDGLADPAVYQATPSTGSTSSPQAGSGQGGTWRVWLSVNGYSMASAQGLGGTGWRPVAGDYDGDGKADPAIYQESTGTWRVWQSNWQYASITAEGLGGSGYRPVPADYDLDGIMDPAVFQASTGTWKIWLSASGYAEANAPGWGNTGTVAVPGDYDGDGLTDPAVYWDAFGIWRLWLSSADYQLTELLVWPGEGYLPVWP